MNPRKQQPNWLVISLVLPSIFLMALSACVPSTTARPDPAASPGTATAERIQTSHKIDLSQANTLSLTNHYGDLHLRNGPGSQASIELFIQRPGGQEVVAEVQASTQSGALELNIQPRPIEDAGTVLRIDAVVTVPSNIPLSLSTDSGEIEVKKLSNPAITANSKSGDLRLTASSIMHANTGRGRIRATIMQPGWSGESEFSTESGQIQAFFPLSKNLSIDAQAVEIKSEFKLGIQYLDGLSRAQFTAGDGTDKIKVKSRQGKVELYSLVFDPRVYGTPSITEKQLIRTDGSKK